MERFQEMLGACPVIPILRGILPEEVFSVMDALASAGIRLAEIPLNSPRALESIRMASERFQASGRLLIGAGTVLNAEDVTRAADAGSSYIVSPNFRKSVVGRTKELRLVSIPGVLTPGEAFDAQDAGADFLKLFPAGRMGAAYIGDLKAVVKTPFLAVGAVTLENAASFLNVCAGIGVGGAIFKPGKPPEKIAEDARTFVLLRQKQVF